METASQQDGAYQLPPDVIKFRDLVRKIVREELIPLEREFLPHSGHALGMKETIKLKNVFVPSPRFSETLAAATRVTLVALALVTCSNAKSPFKV